LAAVFFGDVVFVAIVITGALLPLLHDKSPCQA
jgi:hypothetical protein